MNGLKPSLRYSLLATVLVGAANLAALEFLSLRVNVYFSWIDSM